MSHWAFCIFLFALGACVGSFLNVLVWRVPRFGWKSLVSPPSHCPRCEHLLAWYDNIPVFGWFFLRGRCRYCKAPISFRYPLVEFITAGLFVFYYVMLFMLHVRGMTTIQQQWPMYVLWIVLVSALLAVSLIDAELFLIPPEIPWALAVIGIAVHAVIDIRGTAGAVNVGTSGFGGAVALGGGMGLLVSIVLYQRGCIKQSFPDGEPVLELDEELYRQDVEQAKKDDLPPPPRPKIYSTQEIRAELAKEMLFLIPPMLGALVGGGLVVLVPRVGAAWAELMRYDWLTGLLGAMLGALVGGFVVWITRILGTLGFGRVAMGLGDVHLMFGVGAIVGAGPAVIAFFLAPFAGVLVGLWGLIFRSRRELPFGPYLSLATAAVLLIYPPIAEYLRPGIEAILQAVRGST